MITEAVNAYTYLNLFDDLLLSVVPKIVVYPLLNEFQRWLGPKGVLGRHVEVIHESKKFLPSNRNIHTYSMRENELIIAVRKGQSHFKPFVLFSTFPSIISWTLLEVVCSELILHIILIPNMDACLDMLIPQYCNT